MSEARLLIMSEARWLIALLICSISMVLPSLATGERAALAADGELIWSDPSVSIAGRAYRVRLDALRQRLARAPRESASASGGVEIKLPLPDGRLLPFQAFASPLFSPELEREWPAFKSYRAVGARDPSLSARVDITPFGLRAIVFSPEGTALVDPLEPGHADQVVSTWLEDEEGSPFDCTVDGPAAVPGGPFAGPKDAVLQGEAGRNPLRMFAINLMATGEYTERLGGVLRALGEMATSMSRVNAIFERDGPVRFQIVSLRMFEEAATDPYPVNTTSQLLLRNPAVVDSIFGPDSYHLTQVLSITPHYEGRAFQPTRCYEGHRGISAVTGPDPTSNVFVLKVMPHEIGHMLGATHSQDGGSNRSPATPHEPGSGWTIMSSPGDPQSYGNPYFHVASLAQMDTTLGAPLTCSARFDLGNLAPIADAGPDYTIPRGTPFVLSGIGSGQVADARVTFTWEQVDRAATSGDPVNGPLFRSRPPTASPVRAMPALATVLSGVADPLERLPSVDRTMRFRLTVRDNQPEIGGHAWDEVTVTVQGAPFAVTFPNGGETIASGSPLTVRWTVGGGTIAGSVSLFLSLDAGTSWLPLASSTPNDGTEEMFLDPAWVGGACRIRVEASKNIFYDVSDADFILAPEAAGPADRAQTSAGSAKSGIPETAMIAGLSPSPAHGPVRIDYVLPRAGHVRLSVVDVRGRTVAVLEEGTRPAGRHTATWSRGSALDPAPGLYFVRLAFDRTTHVRKAVVGR